MRIEPDIPDMSEVTVENVQYTWYVLGQIFSTTIHTPPYILDTPVNYDMISPVKVEYHMSNGSHVLYVHPNPTVSDNFVSHGMAPGTMMGYPRVTMIDVAIGIKIKAETIDYVDNARNIPHIKVYDSLGNKKVGANNSVHLTTRRDTELYLAHVYNFYLYGIYKYNPEPAVYAVVRNIKDPSNDVIIDATLSLPNNGKVVQYKYHRYLTTVTDVKAIVNNLEVNVTYTATNGNITVTFPNGLTNTDDVRLRFSVDMFYEGTRQNRDIYKSIYVGV